MTNNPVLSNIQIAQQLVMYQQEMQVLKREEAAILAQVRVELEEKKRQELLSKISND